MSFLAPLALIGAALAVPIILLYMLRLRRREVMVSSTFLWQQVVRDNEANTPWQRLRRNLLLILQLIILALLVLALARPFITVPSFTSGQVALLIDASASMNATDVNGGTRFAAAQARALEIIDTMGASDVMTVIRVADVPQVMSPYTGDRTQLRGAVTAAQPSTSAADWTAALTLASARAGATEEFSIVIISDGGLGEAEQLPAIPGEVSYIPIGASDSNVAITALATRALPGETPQLFAQVTNYSGTDINVVFSLRADGSLISAEEYTIPADSSLPIVAAQLPGEYTALQADLTLPSDSTVADYLGEDNRAFAVPSGGGTRRVLLITPGNLFIEEVLRSLPGVEVVLGLPEDGIPDSEPYDLYVLDGWLPADLPDADLLILNPPDSTDLFTLGGRVETVQNIAVAVNDPRTIYVDFSTINILAFRQVENAAWAQPLVRADGGALLLAGEIGGRQVALLPFDLFESDLPLNITFPIMISNLMEWFTPRSAINVPDGLRVGESLAINPQPEAQDVRVTLPDGTVRDLPVDRATLVFADTAQIGLYTLEVLDDEGEALEAVPFAVNLFDVRESDITPRDQIALGNTVVAEAQEEELGQYEFWGWLAAAALAMLLIEWYAYHQRMRVPTLMSPAVRRKQA